MIYDAMALIQRSLDSYIKPIPSVSGNVVILNNIALADSQGTTNLDNHIVMSLVNVQEESTLKNSPHYRLENGRTVYENPPVNLNLFILFSAFYSEAYDTALKQLSKVIEFFQNQKSLSLSTQSSSGTTALDLLLIPELHSLTFEQLNHLWGALGGKQVPFVLYKVRLVSISAEERIADREPIQEIQLDTAVKPL